ncbi:baseplate J/gp47 family protein [Tumebacillus flagellatus]|uniref:Uncharacterized protein n=1 Tax=Tumebacillus flagellatus TaxID=1157490 RepID=A0A074LIV6_9BACL|nr:baseplate J/gp47 family protein [Tumebacillus flagellatus]KEO82096.1 hypothetical protein EL26_17455 [Tumebacillus flagellatus]
MPVFRDTLASMTSYLQSIGSKLTDFTPTSVVYQILSAVSSVVDQISFSIDNAAKQAYIHSATDDGLDAKGRDLGVPRKQPTPAVWLFTFTKKQTSPNQIPIPKDTIITTLPRPGVAPIVFKVNEDTFMPDGSLYVFVKATCVTPGTIGNISWRTPLLIGSATPGIDGVMLEEENVRYGTPGFDMELDESYRSRLLKGLASKAQGTVTWYEQTLLSVEGVQTVKVVPLGRGIGTVDLYIVGTNNTEPSLDLIAAAQAEIDAGRIITDDARVFKPSMRPIQVNMQIEVEKNAVFETCKTHVTDALKAYINSLGIGGGALGSLYVNQLIRVALEVPGVINVKSVDLGTDEGAVIKFSEFQLPQAGEVKVA